jgi:hypothetical protein
MNERIEQLAEQAGMIIDKYGLARDAQTGLEDGVDIYKFAELIVRECSNMIEDQKATAPPQVAAGLNFAQVIIKEHFGVE